MDEEIKKEPKGLDDIPELDLESYEIPPEERESVRDSSGGCLTFGFVGVGQCGGRIAKSFYDLGYKKSIAVNTAKHDLEKLELPEKHKLLTGIGDDGAGKDMARGRQAAIEHSQGIFDAMKRILGEVDHIFVCFGGGGGTGGGGVVPTIEVAKKYAKYIGLDELDRRVGVIGTLPSHGEAMSPVVSKNALAAAMEVGALAAKGKISPYIIIDNDRIMKLYRGLTVKEFWPKINSSVAKMLHIFNVLASRSSEYMSFDSRDFRSIIETGGCAIMGLTKLDKASNQTDISAAIRDNLEKTMLARSFDLKTAKVAAAVAVGGHRMMATQAGLQDKINYGFDMLANMTGNATIHRGIHEDSREVMRIYTMIGGLALPNTRLNELG